MIIPGSTMGRNKTFFFVDYSISEPEAPALRQASPPYPPRPCAGATFQLQILPIFDIPAPYTDASGNPRRRQFRNNQISADRFSNVSKYFLNLMPLPNVAGSGSINDFVGVVSPSKST